MRCDICGHRTKVTWFGLMADKAGQYRTPDGRLIWAHDGCAQIFGYQQDDGPW